MHEKTRSEKYGGNPTPGQLEKWRINYYHREMDLVSLLMIRNVVIQTETKASDEKTANKTINKAIEQLEFFREYLLRIHASAISDVSFVPTIAFPNLRKLPSAKSQCYCHNENTGEHEVCALYAVSGKQKMTGSLWCHGKKYEVCASTAQGEGCLFFKWLDEDQPVQQTPDSSTGATCCLCAEEPVIFSVPQKALLDSKKQKYKKPKSFKVCKAQNQQCAFFCWVDEPLRLDSTENGLQDEAHVKFAFKGSFCKKHFIYKQHVEDKTKLEEWWKRVCTGPAANPANDNKDTLRSRLIITSSMVFTRLPRILSKLTSESQLVMMRFSSHIE